MTGGSTDCAILETSGWQLRLAGDGHRPRGHEGDFHETRIFNYPKAFQIRKHIAHVSVVLLNSIIGNDYVALGGRSTPHLQPLWTEREP